MLMGQTVSGPNLCLFAPQLAVRDGLSNLSELSFEGVARHNGLIGLGEHIS